MGRDLCDGDRKGQTPPPARWLHRAILLKLAGEEGAQLRDHYHDAQRAMRRAAQPDAGESLGQTLVEPAAELKQIWRKATAQRETRDIPVSQFGRVHTLTNCGMTRAQVAEFYGVTVDEMDRIIRLHS
jgi:hypothetical protein